MEGTPDKGTGSNGDETHFIGYPLQSGEFLRGDISDDRMVVGRWREILPYGENLTTRPKEVLKDADNLPLTFPKTQHKSGFAHDPAVQHSDTIKKFQRTLIDRLWPYFAIESGHRFYIVVDHIGT
jgi:hypothetical protein